MVTVEEAMEKDVIVLKTDDKISDVAQILRKNNISGAPVIDDDQKVIGMISEGDIMKLIEVHSPNINLILPAPFDLIELPVRMEYELEVLSRGVKKAAAVKVEEIMTKNIISIKKDASISDAATLMDSHDINRLPVVDEDNKLIGIITRGDIIGALVK
ncbi:MAG: CBS domain-containing protein [Methanobacteriaceae archaeon]|jgi:CBS domain-containing protein|nr:MAG: CBS domain-containing protein [Methanobacterium sp. BRmetb2]MCC7558656.1 CBS domain-containing protein [Methanobacteriaceae archaeon]